MKISVSVALNTKGPSVKVKEKMKVARAALKHLAKVGMGSGVINAAAMDKIIASLNALKGYDKLPVIGAQIEVGEHFRDVINRDKVTPARFAKFVERAGNLATALADLQKSAVAPSNPAMKYAPALGGMSTVPADFFKELQAVAPEKAAAMFERRLKPTNKVIAEKKVPPYLRTALRKRGLNLQAVYKMIQKSGLTADVKKQALHQFATWDESFQVALRTAIREL